MIGEAQLNDITSRLAGLPLNEEVVAGLRESWPDVHFTFCSDDDIPTIRPARETEDFNLYLVVAGTGCINFTADPQAATGIVIAEIEAWEEI